METNIKNEAFSEDVESDTWSKWLTSSEAACYLRISTPQLYNLTSTGNLPYYKFGRSNRYKRDDLDSFIERNRRGLDEY